jgi:hypothetical protein
MLKGNKHLYKLFKFNFCSPKSKGNKEFEKRLNSTDPLPEDYANIEQYSKIFNEKIYKQNLEITNKLNEIFTQDGNANIGTKVFTAVNEINRINLNNTSTMLQVFLNQILKYNDSVRLFIQHSERKGSRSNSYILMTALFVWVFGGIYLYNQYKQSVNYDHFFENMLKNYYDNSPERYKLETDLPVYNDSEYIGSIVNFVGAGNLILIGASGIGKSEAMRSFCTKQWNKDNLYIYFDLNTRPHSGDNCRFDKLVIKALGDGYNKLDRSDIFYTTLFEKLKDKEAVFVFDNYKHERDECFLFNNIEFFKNNKNWKSITVADNNDIYQQGITNDMGIKYISFSQSGNFKSYLFDKISNYCRKKVKYTNLELFTSDNLNGIYDNLAYFSYGDLQKYLEFNSTIRSIYCH